MGRHPEPEISRNLLAVCTDYSLQNGLPDRLDPLVQATGASARMLLYHFGTRDALLLEILRQARQRQVARFGAWLRPRPGQHYVDRLRDAWAGMTGPEGQPFVRMFSQFRQNAETALWPGFRRIATTDWLQPLEEGLKTMDRAPSATLVLAVIRGLLMDREATGDKTRTDDAFREFLTGLDAGS